LMLGKVVLMLGRVVLMSERAVLMHTRGVLKSRRGVLLPWGDILPVRGDVLLPREGILLVWGAVFIFCFLSFFILLSLAGNGQHCLQWRTCQTKSDVSALLLLLSYTALQRQPPAIEAMQS
jgi:hypothetical protein